MIQPKYCRLRINELHNCIKLIIYSSLAITFTSCILISYFKRIMTIFLKIVFSLWHFRGRYRIYGRGLTQGTILLGGGLLELGGLEACFPSPPGKILKYQHYKHMMCLLQVCVVLKSVLSKAIVRCKAKHMLQDTIGSRSHKSGRGAV